MCIIAIFFDAATTTRFLSWENYFKGKLNYLLFKELGLVDNLEVRPWLEVNFVVFHSAEIEEFFFELYFYMNYDWKTSETLNLTILEAMEFDLVDYGIFSVLYFTKIENSEPAEVLAF